LVDNRDLSLNEKAELGVSASKIIL
jgi:hypothetical protein